MQLTDFMDILVLQPKTQESVSSLQAVCLGSLPEAADVLNQMPCFM